MKTISYRGAYTAKGPKPSQFKDLFNKHPPYCSQFFSKGSCSKETGEVEQPRVVSPAGLFGSGSGLKLTKISVLVRA